MFYIWIVIQNQTYRKREKCGNTSLNLKPQKVQFSDWIAYATLSKPVLLLAALVKSIDLE
jgi:hypothetical protein